MSGRAQFGAIDVEQSLLVAVVGEEERRRQQVEPVTSGPGIGRLGAHGGDEDRRSRPLQGRGRERMRLQRRPPPLHTHLPLGPQRADDGQVFVEAGAAFAHPHIRYVIVIFIQPVANAEIQPSARQHIDHGVVLGRSDGVVQRQQAIPAPRRMRLVSRAQTVMKIAGEPEAKPGTRCSANQAARKPNSSPSFTSVIMFSYQSRYAPENSAW